jgi:uncharacterized membrane protein
MYGSVRTRQIALRLSASMLVIPAIYVVLALGLSFGLTQWDKSDPATFGSISAASAQTALSALASGMLAFTGFVTSVVLLVVQFGTSEFSTRLVRWFNRDTTLRYALGTFTATFLYALVSTAQINTGSGSAPPSRTLVAALVLTLLSIFMFLRLVTKTSNGLRVASVVQSLDVTARQVFDDVYPTSASDAAQAEKAAHRLRNDAPIQTVYADDVGAVIVTLDQRGLVALAQQGNAVIEMVHAVGDHVPPRAPLLNVHGDHPLPAKRLRRAVFMDDERTIDDDPSFALRMLVDIAIKALSPAVNDPTTAVQSLDRIEDLLRYAAEKHLSVGFVADKNGTTRLVFPTPTWEDLVELALDEIRQFGANQYQIARRVRALLDSLLEDLPESRQQALHRQMKLLNDAVTSAFSEDQRTDAMVPDRQGIGMSRRDLSAA